MKQLLAFLAFGIVGLVFQATVLGEDGLLRFVPDALLVLSVFVAFRSPSASGLLVAFLLGLMGDCASARFLGPNAAGCMAGFLVTVALSRWVLADHGAGLFGLTALASLVKSVVVLVFIRAYFPIHESIVLIAGRVLAEALLSSILAVVVVWWWGRVPGAGRAGVGYSAGRTGAVAY